VTDFAVLQQKIYELDPEAYVAAIREVSQRKTWNSAVDQSLRLTLSSLPFAETILP
jgi:hypothetical protein